MRPEDLPERLTRAAVAECTRLPDDVLAYWIKEGLLRPVVDSTGTGRHKFFSRVEVNKVGILANLRNFRCSIQSIRWFASLIDQANQWRGRYPDLTGYQFHRASTLASMYRRLLKGEEVKALGYGTGEYVVMSSLDDLMGIDQREHSAEAMASIRQIVQLAVDDQFAIKALKAAADIDEQQLFDYRYRQIWLAWPVGESWEIYSDTDENLTGIRDWPQAAIFLHITETLRSLWRIVVPSRWDS